MAGTRSLGTLTLDLIARIGGFTGPLSKAERELRRSTESMGRALDGLDSRIRGLFFILGGVSLVRGIIRNTAEAENALAQLDAALISTGGAAGYTRDQLTAMAQRMATETVHSVDEITAAQTRLLSYTTVVGETYPRALQAAIDQSVRLGITLSQSAEIIGRAIETPSRGVASLTRQGFHFTESQKSLLRSLEQSGRLMEAQAVVLDVIEESYGGAGRAARDTFGGALTAVQNSVKDLLTGKDSVPELTASLNEFAATLQDPGFKQAADSVLGGIADYINLVTQGAIGWAYRFGLAGDELTKIDREIEKVQNRIASMERRQGGGAWNWFGRLLHGDSADKLAEARRELAALSKEWWAMLDRRASPAETPVTGPAGPALPPPPSEEFLKLESRLREQIALFGKVGEAAKIAYQIQSGQLDELSKSEQQRVLSLARQYDSLVENAAAEKELEAARKQLDATLKSQVANYEQQIALPGEVTELERIRYEIANGALKGITADQAAYLESLAEQIDKNKEWQSVVERGKALTESLRTPLEVYEDTLADVNELLDKGAISYETYARAVERAQDELKKATDEWNTFKEQAARNTQDIIADTLVNGFEDGTKGILKAFGDMIVQLTAQAVAADLAKKLFGDPNSSSSDGGWIGAAFNFLGGFFGPTGGRAAGGPVSAGNMYRVNEVEGEYFIPNSSGTVVPLSKMNWGGQNVTNNFNIVTPNGQMSLQTRQQIMADVARGMALANRRNN